MNRKKKAQQKHAARRARERLGIRMDQNRMHQLVQLIQEGGLELHSKQSNRVSRYLHTLDGERVLLVYDRKRKTVVTVWKVDEEGAYIAGA